jgi:hypothetical protein
MSSTHKPKPPDRGAPAHKPSRKVALDEVLRSLQDLVQNELSVDTPVAGKPEAPADTGARDAAPTSSPAGADTVAQDLPPLVDLVQNEPNVATPVAAEPETPAAPAAPEPAPAVSPSEPTAGDTVALDLPPLVDLDASPAPADTPPPVALSPAEAPVSASVPPGGLQQELPYLDTPGPGVAEPVPPANAPTLAPALVADPFAGDRPPASGQDAMARSGSEPVIDIAEPPRPPGGPTTSTAPALGEAVDFRDIPVLEDAVELNEDFPALETPAAEPGPKPVNPLILARDARRLAIQVAARLNVSLRREGKAGLSSDIIARLAHELEQALAKDDANMENTKPQRH